MMGSNGGLLSVERTCRQPIALVESGPIGGCIGAGAYAEALGFTNVIAFDMGGTTAKCALVENGRFSVESIYYAGGYVKGFPIKSPVIDIVEVGSGGGSIAWLDPQNRLHVGPQSAGSTPGPVCYGQRRHRADRDRRQPGARPAQPRPLPRRRVEARCRRRAHGDRSASPTPLGYTGADGVDRRWRTASSSIATVIMAGAIKQISVEHGLDPRDFVLFCYGGGGPLHASALARELSIPTVVIPPEPGNFSAVGMLLADARLDLSKTFTGVLDDDTIAALKDAVRAPWRTRRARRSQREFGAGEVMFERYAEMRYRRPAPQHQGADLRPRRSRRRSAQAFDRDYKRRYGHADAQRRGRVPGAASLRLRAAAAAGARAACRARDGGRTRRQRARSISARPAACCEATIYDRTALAPGFKAQGPGA